MEKRFKLISLVIAILNLVLGLVLIFIETENNLYWAGAFVFNTALILINIKRNIPVTPLFLLCVYYMFWAMIHIGPNPQLTEEGRKVEFLISAFAFIAFLSIGWLYYINRKRW